MLQLRNVHSPGLPLNRFFQPDDKGTLNDGRRTGFSSKTIYTTSGRNDAVVLYTTASTKLDVYIEDTLRASETAYVHF